MSEVSYAWSWYQIGESQRMALTFFFFLLSTIIFILHRKAEKTKGMPGLPPGPRGLPLVGYLPFLRPDLHSCFADLAKIFGPVMMMKLGSRQCLILSSPEAAKEVLRDHDATFANHDMTVAASIITFGGQDMGFQPYGPLWRALRKACVRELLNAQTMDSFRTLRQQEVTLMAKELHRRAGTPVPVGQLVFVTSFNVITSMLWGNSLVADELERIRGEFREVVVGIVDLLGVTNVSDIFPILERMDLQGVQRKMKQHKEKLDGVLSTVIDRRVNNRGDQEKAQDFLQAMLELVKKEDPHEHLTVDNIKGLFTNLIIAGIDTSSTTIEWAMAEMIDKPETIRKAKEELDSVVGKDEIVDESHLPKLLYLEALVKETLRLHPPVPLLVPRYPTATCNIGGCTIPKGTKVFINVWSIHRDPAVWENPLEFKPERFLAGMSKCDYYGNNFNFIPFGSGRRICVGIPLAEKMSLYILATMLHCFDWSLPDGMKLDLVEKFGIVLKMEKQLVAIPTARPSCAKLRD